MNYPKPKPRYIIGIDPDLHKPGVAVYSLTENKFELCQTMTIKKMFDYFATCRNADILYIVEHPDSTRTWHGGGRGSSIDVGRNQGVAIMIYEYLIECGYNVKKVAPAGYSKIFKNAETFKTNTGWTGQTNEDARAAAAIVHFNKHLL